MSALLAFARQVHTATRGLHYSPNPPIGCVEKTVIVVSHERYAELLLSDGAADFFGPGPHPTYRGVPVEGEDGVDDRDVIIRREVTAPRWGYGQ